MVIRTTLIAGLAVFTLPNLALAQETPDSQPSLQQSGEMSPTPQIQAAPVEQEPGNNFWEGDILRIVAYGREDLTGEHTVQPGRMLSLPLIGSVELAQLNPRQLEEKLAKAWENRLGAPMSVSIEFSERAPIYVLGDVTSPGAYPYRGGMIVLQAIAVSGGFEKFARNDPRLRMEILREREKRQQAIDRMALALATRARLLAERDGQKSLELEEPFDLVPQARMNKLLADQTALMDINNKQQALKETAFTDQIRLGEEEISSLQQQIDSLAVQQDVTDKEAARLRRVPGQQNRHFDLEQRSSSLAANRVGIMGNISRAKREVETARNAIAAAREARQQVIATTLLQAETDYEEARLAVRTSNELLEAAGFGTDEPVFEFTLMHRGEAAGAPVDPSTAIRPGDLVNVRILPQAADDAPAALSQQQPAPPATATEP